MFVLTGSLGQEPGDVALVSGGSAGGGGVGGREHTESVTSLTEAARLTNDDDFQSFNSKYFFF